jgi:hypothetical protein
LVGLFVWSVGGRSVLVGRLVRRSVGQLVVSPVGRFVASGRSVGRSVLVGLVDRLSGESVGMLGRRWVGWLAGRSVCLVGRSFCFGRWVGRSAGRLSGRSVGCLVGQSVCLVCPVGLVDRLSVLSVGLLSGRSFNRSMCRPVDCLVGRSLGWFVGWSAGRSLGGLNLSKGIPGLPSQKHFSDT